VPDQLFLGIDLGGTDTKYGIVDARGHVLRKGRWPTEPERGPEGVLEQVARHAREMIGSDTVLAVGMGVPGPMSSRLGVIFEAPNLPGWKNVPVQQIMEKHLGLPVRLNNDANAAAWGEFRAGAGRGASTMILYTLGTGVGGGIIIDGELLCGPDDTAGELGHVVVNPAGPRCGCGNRGCLEAYASATAFRRRVREAVAAGIKTSIEIPPGEEDTIGAKPVFDAALRGDVLACEIVAEAGRMLGLAAAGMINALNPDVIAYSGGMSQAGPVLFDWIISTAKANSFAKPFSRVRIVPAELGNDAGLIGAAGLAMRSAGGE
jgi:glucokinase